MLPWWEGNGDRGGGPGAGFVRRIRTGILTRYHVPRPSQPMAGAHLAHKLGPLHLADRNDSGKASPSNAIRAMRSASVDDALLHLEVL
jgi:hypothetical protein